MRTLTENELQELRHLFTYHPATEENKIAYEAITRAAEQFARTILEHGVPGPFRDLAFTDVIRARMLVNANRMRRGVGAKAPGQVRDDMGESWVRCDSIVFEPEPEGFDKGPVKFEIVDGGYMVYYDLYRGSEFRGSSFRFYPLPPRIDARSRLLHAARIRRAVRGFSGE